MAPPSINTQIVITAGNKWIPLIIDLAGAPPPTDYTTSIAEGTYDDIQAVVAAIQVAIRAVGAGLIIPNATCSVIFTGAVPGMVMFDFSADLGAGDTVEMDWLNNAHGSAGADDHIGTILGFDDTADDGPIGALWYFVSDWQHMYGWYATRAIRSYGPPLAVQVGGAFRKTLSRTYAKTLHIGYEYQYDFILEALEPWHFLWYEATGANTNRNLDAVLDQMVQGEPFRVREDQEVLGIALDVYLEEPRDLYRAVKRRYPDYECYDIALRFVTG
jgi:hypothetical protein